MEYYEGDLGLTDKEWKTLPRISLREAALKSNPKNDFMASRCHCKTACKSNSCACKKRGVPCIQASVTVGLSVKIRSLMISKPPYLERGSQEGQKTKETTGKYTYLSQV